jgi:hypothetical protein
MAYADAADGESTDSDLEGTAPMAGDADYREPAEIGLQAAELPAFLTEDEPGDGGLNGALVS